jgi:gephyrin
MLSVDEALEMIAQNTPSPTPVRRPVNEDLVGYVLASDVKGPEAVPAFRASIVDGYAIRIPSGGPSSGVFEKGTYAVAMVSHAQAVDLAELREGLIARITTGAPLPPGADAVVMVEDTVLQSLTEDGKEEKTVEVLTSEIKRGENVREIGSDVQAGSIILRKGEGITSAGGELGLLASVGVNEVEVYKKPVVAILSTGDEIVPHNRANPLRLGEVRDTNRPTLITAVRGTGFDAIDMGIASDKYIFLFHFGRSHRSRANMSNA